MDQSPADLKALPSEDLDAMADAAQRVVDCYRVLQKSGANVVGEVLKEQGTFFEFDHYPKGDVYDSETHSQYYYHAHPSERRSGLYGSEHGHFHTFLRPRGMPQGMAPAPLDDYVAPADPDDALSHLIGVSMDRAGFPIRFFTTNRWVTGEVWYPAGDVIAMLDRFDMDLSYPSWPVNVWLTNLMRLFRPDIAALLHRRDAAVADWQAEYPDRNAYEDRELEITSVAAIDVPGRVAALNAALAD